MSKMFGFFSSAMPRYYTPVPAYRGKSTAPVRHFESDEKQQKLHLYSHFTPLFKCNIPNMCQSAVMWCMQSRAAFFLRHSPQRFTFMQYILLLVPSLQDNGSGAQNEARARRKFEISVQRYHALGLSIIKRIGISNFARSLKHSNSDCGYPCQHKSLEDFKQKADL